MERERIAVLLDKFWKGETSLEEEKELMHYFDGENIAGEFSQDAGWFKYLEAQKEKKAPSDEEILSLIDNIQPEVPGKRPLIMWLGNFSKAAAVIFIVAVAAFLVHDDYQSKKEKMEPVIADTFEDPQKAFEETKKALMLVSQQFGKGKKHAQKLGVFDDAKEKVKTEI